MVNNENLNFIDRLRQFKKNFNIQDDYQTKKGKVLGKILTIIALFMLILLMIKEFYYLIKLLYYIILSSKMILL